MNTFLFATLIAVSCGTIFAAPQTTLSQMKVDEALFCRDLCKYDLSGPGCDVDCSTIETTSEVINVAPEFCDVLCKHGLGYNRCKCKEVDVENIIKNENVMVCFGFVIYNNVTLNGCPECPFHGMSHHRPTSTEGSHAGGGRPSGNPYANFIVTPEDKKLAEEFKKMYCGFTCKNHPERGSNYCKCAKTE